MFELNSKPNDFKNLSRHVVLIALLALLGITVLQNSAHRVIYAQDFQETDLYHWILPAHSTGIEISLLHPNDCYVINHAEGFAYFGEPPVGLLELQRLLNPQISHLLEGNSHDPEQKIDCNEGLCLDSAEISRVILRRLTEAGKDNQLRMADHQPFDPTDSGNGGVYTDVGSDNRLTYRGRKEQRSIAQHLLTSKRLNCYQASAPRMLSVHIRTLANRSKHTGLYSGYLTVRHFHEPVPENRIANKLMH